MLVRCGSLESGMGDVVSTSPIIIYLNKGLWLIVANLNNLVL